MYSFSVKSEVTSEEMVGPLSLNSSQEYETKEEALEALELQYKIIEGFLNNGNLSFLEGEESFLDLEKINNITTESKIEKNNKKSDSYEVDGWYLGTDNILYKAHYTGSVKEVV